MLLLLLFSFFVGAKAFFLFCISVISEELGRTNFRNNSHVSSDLSKDLHISAPCCQRIGIFFDARLVGGCIIIIIVIVSARAS